PLSRPGPLVGSLRPRRGAAGGRRLGALARARAAAPPAPALGHRRAGPALSLEYGGALVGARHPHWSRGACRRSILADPCRLACRAGAGAAPDAPSATRRAAPDSRLLP